MITFLFVLVALAMLATLCVLFAGVLGVTRGKSDPRRSNKLMQWRILLQGISIALFALLLYAMRG